MNRHIHADKIIAKAENMDLVVLVKHGTKSNPNWLVTNDKNSINLPIWDKDSDYFLCLEEHKEACLHWLNGGEVQYLRSVKSTWGAVESIGDSYENEAEHLECSIDELGDFNPTSWETDSIFMQDDFELRIKPKKEKRYIAAFPWCGNNEYVMPSFFNSIGELEEYVYLHYGTRDRSQIIEIEVEV